MTGATEAVAATTKDVASKAPHWAALIIVIVSFLFFMAWMQTNSNMLAEQRIETCHAVQEKSNVVLEKLADVLVEESREYALMREEISDLRETMRRHTEAIDRLVNKLDS